MEGLGPQESKSSGTSKNGDKDASESRVSTVNIHHSTEGVSGPMCRKFVSKVTI